MGGGGACRKLGVAVGGGGGGAIQFVGGGDPFALSPPPETFHVIFQLTGCAYMPAAVL